LVSRSVTGGLNYLLSDCPPFRSIIAVMAASAPKSAAPRGKLNDRATTKVSEKLDQRVHSFWHRVTEGLELADLWTQFKTEARTGYRLYSREVPTEHLEGVSGGQRVWHVTKVLFWAVLSKLSPARRVVLLVACVLLVFPFSFHFGALYLQASTLHILGGLLLLGLLLLEIGDRVTLKRDLQIAREIQLWLVPEAPPQVPGLDIAFFNRPANTVAGDYYDVFPRETLCEESKDDTPTSSAVLIAVADVAGKSLPAALLMATFQASLHTLSGQRGSLLELTAGVNRYACDHSRGGQRFTTAFLAEYERKGGRLTYINAGHNAPILQRANGSVERLGTGGVPLGITPDAYYECGTAVLALGDVLVIFTDGLVEAINYADEEYGEERLLKGLQVNREFVASEIVERMMRAVDFFVGMTPQHDDMTGVVIRRV